MAEPIRIPTPMWRVQYQLLGGHRRIFIVLAISLFVMVFGFLGFRRIVSDMPLARVAGIVLMILTGAQGILIVMGGCNAVYRGMLRDYETRMLESHRLTPMSNIAVVLGYLFGTTLQTMLMFLVIMLFGSAITFLAGSTISFWLAGNLILLNGAITLWAIVVFTGLRPGKPISPAGPLIGIGVFGNLGILMLPAAGLTLGAYSIALSLLMLWGMGTPPRITMIALAALNLPLTAYWVIAAAAKYRRPDLPALNAVRGTVLLCIWVVLGTIGIAAMQTVATGVGISANDLPQEDVLWLTTMGLALVLALIPINGSVECRILEIRGTALRGWSDRVSDVSVAVLSAGLICGLMLALGKSIWTTFDTEVPFPNGADAGAYGHIVGWTLTLAACTLALMTVRAVFTLGYALLSSPKVMFGIFILLAWVIPSMLDAMIAEALRPHYSQLTLTWAFGISPLGTLAIAWVGVPASYAPGLVVQFVIAIVATTLASRAVRILKAKINVAREPRASESDANRAIA